MAIFAVAVMLSLAGLYDASTLSCICTMEYAPVCGVDGKTYSNKCGLNCAGVQLAYTGGCQSVVQTNPLGTHLCACPRNVSPVCGQDGKTYGNQCELNCAGVAYFQAGSCPASSAPGIQKRAVLPCICTFIYRPVCGSDGVTYGNDCNRECASHEVQLLGKAAITAVSNGQCPATARTFPTSTTTTASKTTTNKP